MFVNSRFLFNQPQKYDYFRIYQKKSLICGRFNPIFTLEDQVLP